MKEMDNEAWKVRRNEVRLAMQDAMIGLITPRIRAITFSFDAMSIHFKCYLEGGVTENDREDMSLMETEMLATFPASHQISYEIIRRDMPEPFLEHGDTDQEVVYHRKE